VTDGNNNGNNNDINNDTNNGNNIGNNKLVPNKDGIIYDADGLLGKLNDDGKVTVTK